MTPGAVAIFSFVENGIRVSEASVPDVPPAPAFHLYAEVSGGASQSPGSKRSEFAITNSSAAPQDVTVQLLPEQPLTRTARSRPSLSMLMRGSYVCQTGTALALPNQ
jgi:hypothetical protein